MQTDIKILVRLHSSLVIVRQCSWVQRQPFRFAGSFHLAARFSRWADAWITVQLKSQGRAFDGVMRKAGSPETYLSLLEARVQRSQIQKTDWSDHPVRSLGGPRLHLNLPFNQLNQWKELIREGTSSPAARSIWHTSGRLRLLAGHGCGRATLCGRSAGPKIR